jgi:hypothetical protein
MMSRIVAAVCVLVTLLPGDAGATVLTPIEFSELVRASQAIAYGQVLSVRARQSGDRLRIETLVTLRVDRYLKGDLGPEVTLLVPGGTLGRYRSIVVGAPRFTEGEEVVLFLSARGPSIPYVLRLGQGVFRVVREPISGERMIAPVPLFTGALEWHAVVRGDPQRGRMSLNDFAVRIRNLGEEGR